MYQGIITLDYTAQDANKFQRLQNALDQCGWQYAETSAFVLESETLDEVQHALECLAHYLPEAGTLSALSINIQRVQPHLQVPAKKNHGRALTYVLSTPVPPRC